MVPSTTTFDLQNEKQEADRKCIRARGICEFRQIVTRGISLQLLMGNAQVGAFHHTRDSSVIGCSSRFDNRLLCRSVVIGQCKDLSLNDEIHDLHDSVLNNSGTPALQAVGRGARKALRVFGSGLTIS